MTPSVPTSLFASFPRVTGSIARGVRWVCCGLALFCPLVASATAATLPPGFSESVVAGGLKSPTAMAVAPDGRLFVCEQGGQLRVVSAAGALLAAPFTTLTVDSNGERGLLGIAFDPGFATNQFVYVYYTATAPVTHNRVSRFTANGDVAVAGSEVAILDLDPLSSATNHNGGAIHFGPDGKLYVAVGENANGNNSQSLANRLGKMLRIGADGSIPVDNPFYATAVGANRSIWALGLRNPFTFAFQRFTGAMFINDVGQNTWEEIDLGRAGANYGWPTTEGYTNDPRFQTPFYEYDHSNACAISGGDFYTPLTTRFPAQYSGAYFFGDYCGGWIHLRDPGTGAVTNFADGISFLVDVTVSQDGGLYYLAQHGGANSTGVVVRVDYAGAPTVTVTANGSHGPLVLAPGDPLTIAVSFALGSAPTLNPAELYIGVGTRFGTFWMDPVSHLFLPAVVPAFTGPLAAFGPTTVVNVRNVSSLPPGPYWWVVAVDNDSNGLLNAVFYDVVETTVP